MELLIRDMAASKKTLCTSGLSCLLSLFIFLGAFPYHKSCLAAFNLDQVEAAFIFNLTNFVRWPNANLKEDQPFVIGVMGDQKVANNLRIITSGEKIKGRQTLIKWVTEPSDVEDCDILFVGSSYKGNIEEILRAAAGRPILTLGESEDFLKKGGMVAFIFTGKRIQIEISVEAAQKEGISFNSKLLRIARIFKPGLER